MLMFKKKYKPKHLSILPKPVNHPAAPPLPKEKQFRCDRCIFYRWNKEFEYEYCAKDPYAMRLPIYRPMWCPCADWNEKDLVSW